MKNNVLTRLMSMDEKAWQRHANPLSVWSRVITGLPAILVPIWCIKPMGRLSLLLMVCALFWLWLNPRLFSIPSNTDNWASKVTFGERVWLNRAEIPIPKHHSHWAILLSFTAAIGLLIAMVGAYQNMTLPTVAGGMISWFGKMWFCDRMVWLYEDMRSVSEKYNSWTKV
jgi:hypothetical protein